MEPSAKVAGREETAGTNLGTLQQFTEEGPPETSTAAGPASSTTSTLPLLTATGAVESPAVTDITQVSAVTGEPSNSMAEPATGMPIPPIAPPSLVLPLASNPGRPLSNIVGGPTSVPPARPPLRSATSTNAIAPVRPLTRVTPVAAVGAPPPTTMDPDREREMNLLRARILEQESKRKGRRLIRPRIEPPGATSSSMEVGEGSQEVVSEIVDTDVEAVTEGKLPVISEIPDSSGSPSTGVADAVATTVTAAAAAEAPVMVAPAATGVAVARKRAATLREIAPSDDDLLQESKLENAPPHKKSRPAEGTSIQDSTPALQDNVHHDVSAEPSQTVLRSDSVGHRPVGDTSEAPALKKPRFLQAEVVPPQSVEKISSSQSLDVNEPTEVANREPLQPGELGREPSKQLQEVGNETPEASDLPVFKSEDQIAEAPILIESMPDIPLEPPVSDSEQFLDMIVGNAVDEALDHFQRAGFEPEAILTETVTTTTAVIEEETAVMKEITVTEAETRNVDEAEEGEIVSEVVEDVTTSPVEVMASDPIVSEGKVPEPESVSKTEVEVPTSTTPVAVEHSPDGAEAAGTSNAPVETEASIPSIAAPEAGKSDIAVTAEIASAEETMSETVTAVEAASGHRTRLATGTVIRPSPGRGGTTINLADRAKERAALRQSVAERATPASPGGRGRGRGGRTKRGAAAGRGRMVSTGAGGRGERSGTPPPGGPTGTNPGEHSQQQSTNPSNTYDFANTKDSQS